MEPTDLSLHYLFFLPLAMSVGFGVAALVSNLVRLSRYPGFAGRFDPELAFLNRGPRLVAIAVLIVFVLVPTAIGIALQLEPSRRQPQGEPVATVEAAEVATHEGIGSVAPPLLPAAPPESRATVAPATAVATIHRELVPMDLQTHAVRETRHFGPELVTETAWPESLTPVDVLFVHAHPDDESLDFAVLMAALARSGKRIATLLLTDGESGLDRYPDRGDHPGYPSGRLTGEALRKIRIRETVRALSVLGSHYYLRLALPNHPYNSIAEELSIDQVLDVWGGEEKLVLKLRNLIATLQPALVVGPDGPSEAREHFEHEAAGYLVRRAVEKARTDGVGPLGYLVSVDPFQREHYPESIAVPKSPRGEDLRIVQRAALSQHHTQADASVIGIRRLADLPFEFYLPVHWDLDRSLFDLIGSDAPR